MSLFPDETLDLDVQLMYDNPKGDFVIAPGVTQVFAIDTSQATTVTIGTLHTLLTQDSTIRFWISQKPIRNPVVEDNWRSHWTASREYAERPFTRDELPRPVYYLNVKNLQNAENAYYLEIRVE